jgi:signal transduction histidine kinase
MFSFFKPNSKVQRDRHVLRETDSRMAKYSRRGLIFNFLAFLVCIAEGHYIEQSRTTAIVLTIGLLLVTCLRGWFVFRFDQIYPHAPARWRNGYFASTLLGAIWWGLILFSITLEVGFVKETPLIWLYTVIFFSTTAHAFAPFHRFLTYYQFFGLIPASAAAFLVGGWTSSLYGAMMICFYLILAHQCRLISDNYWEKLEASYALSRKAIREETERRENRENLQLTKEFLGALKTELNLINDAAKGASVSDKMLQDLERSITTVSSVVNKNLTIDRRAFNIRHEIQYLTSKHLDLAESRDIHLETSLSPTLPMRLKGDAVRFAQVVETLLEAMILVSESATLIVEVQFLREYEKAGELILTIRRNVQSSRLSMFSDKKNLSIPNTLDVVTAKALADTMGGDIEIIENASGESQLRFEAKLDISDAAGHLDFHKGRFNGNQILLVCSNAQIVDIKRQELSALGFEVTTETQHKRAKQILMNSIRSGRAIENLLLYFENGNNPCEDLIYALSDDDELKGINKIVAATPAQISDSNLRSLNENNSFFYVNRPVGLFELESIFNYIFSRGEKNAKQVEGRAVFHHDGELTDTELSRELAKSDDLIIHSSSLNKMIQELEKGNAEIALILCEKGAEYREAVDAIRSVEKARGDFCNFIPVIGLGNRCSERDVLAFESGFDDYIDISSAGSADVEARLKYWASLQH